MVVTIQRPITYVSYSLEGMKQYIIYRHFYRAMRMYSADYAVERCLSVCLSHAGILSKGINISQPFHTILIFQYQTVWQYTDGDPPNRGAECKEV